MIKKILPIFILLFWLCSCGGDLLEEETYNTVSNMKQFTITGQLAIHYLDENGNELISKDDVSTWPVAAKEQLPLDSLDSIRSKRMETDSISSYGNDQISWGKESCCFIPKIWGDGTGKFTTFVHVAGGIDKIVTGYRYRQEGTIWFPYKQYMLYNGVTVWMKGDLIREVRVKKTSDGKTIVYSVPTK